MRNLPTQQPDDFKHQIERLIEIGIAVSSELNLDVLLEKIVSYARELTNADGGTIYLLESNQLHAKIAQNGTLGKEEAITLLPVPLIKTNVSAYTAFTEKTIKIHDVYDSEAFDFTGPLCFDKMWGYRTRSMLLVPMKNHKGKIIGVLLLINATDPKTGEVTEFPDECVSLVKAFASQAAAAITNATLIEETQALNAELQREIADRIRAEEEVGKLNERLEGRVRERTAQLEATNRKLETEITKRVRIEEALRNLSLTDELTNLYNRRGFLTLAQQQLQLACQTKREIFLVFVDLDGMKWINDTFGHHQGDRALMEIASLLKDTFRGSDIMARIGGDEFVVLALEPYGGNAEMLTRRLQKRMEARNAQGDRPYKLSISVGIAHYDFRHPCSIDELLSKADTLMYEQKQDKQKS